jgi:TATA-box binding protein (TBP) (component of TFIID and TFIIIB)
MNFDDIKVSTKTFTASTNVTFFIDKIFDFLPITPYKLVKKKRGRKSGEDLLNDKIAKSMNNIPPGSIITVKVRDKIRGIELKPKKNKKKKWFRNSITIVMMLDKPINFKICLNGTFQMTGCKSIKHAQDCVKYFWNIIHKNKDLWELKKGEKKVEILFIPCMRNMDFSINYLVDREKLNNFIYKNKETFHCLLETSFGYTGVNIKIPSNKDIKQIKLDKMIWVNRKKWNNVKVPYMEYVETLSERMKKTKLEQTYYNTFLVFHSGKVIMSGLTKEFMRDDFYTFLKIMTSSRKYIEEKLD